MSSVIAYILLCGFAPFAGGDDLETIRLVTNGKLDFPTPEWDTISDEAKDFVRYLLRRDPYERPTAAEALKHPWVSQHVVEPGIPPSRPFLSRRSQSNDDVLGGQTISAEIRWESTRRTAFQKFLAGLKVRKAIAGATEELTPKEAKYLGQVFRKVDQDQDGKITVVELDQAVSSPTFSTSVKQNLSRMRSHLAAHPQLSLDIRPFIGFVDRRAKSDSVIEDQLESQE